MIFEKIIKTVKLCQINKELKKDRDVAVEYICGGETENTDDLRATILRGAVVTDNEIALHCQEIRDIWGIDF